MDVGRPLQRATTVEPWCAPARVLDRTPHMSLVEAGDAQPADLAVALPRWLVAREGTFALERPADGGQ